MIFYAIVHSRVIVGNRFQFTVVNHIQTKDLNTFCDGDRLINKIFLHAKDQKLDKTTHFNGLDAVFLLSFLLMRQRRINTEHLITIDRSFVRSLIHVHWVLQTICNKQQRSNIICCRWRRRRRRRCCCCS